MARQEATNTFVDGMMSDLNPINTPKTVLTDCLNGTYITYNGNEFILQNDMGNYELKNCKLPSNFIPVGIKSYADVLYIISYNPLTKEVEVGSYPAPQSIFSIGENKIETEDISPYTFYKDGQAQTYEYPNIVVEQKKPLFVFMGDNAEESKLYPGDDFKLEIDTTDLDFIYQHLNFYVIDEDNKTYDINDNELYTGTVQDNGFRKVFWETPGWLAAQYTLYVPDKFNLNIRSLNIPEFIIQNTSETSRLDAGENKFSVSIDLSTQTIISNLLFQKELNNNIETNENFFEVYKHLYIRFITPIGENYGEFQGINYNGEAELKDDDKTIIKNDIKYYYVDIPCSSHNYQDNIITAYNNVLPVWSYPNPEGSIQDYSGKLELSAYPIIKIDSAVDDSSQVLEYTQFKTTIQYDLNNIQDVSEISITNKMYKWSVDEDSCTLSFNIEGPIINSKDITGRIEIYRYNLYNTVNIKECFDRTYIDEWEADPKNITNDDYANKAILVYQSVIPNLVLYGQNVVNLVFSDSFIYIDSKLPQLDFSKEGGIYICRIILENNGAFIKRKDNILIPSEIFNDYFGSTDNYNNISLDQWVLKYINSITSDVNFTKITPNEDKNAQIIEDSGTGQGLANILSRISSKETFATEVIWEWLANKTTNDYVKIPKPPVYNPNFSGPYEFTIKNNLFNINKQPIINLGNIYPSLFVNQTGNISLLEGKLWNPIKTVECVFGDLRTEQTKTQTGWEYNILSWGISQKADFKLTGSNIDINIPDWQQLFKFSDYSWCLSCGWLQGKNNGFKFAYYEDDSGSTTDVPVISTVDIDTGKTYSNWNGNPLYNDLKFRIGQISHCYNLSGWSEAAILLSNEYTSNTEDLNKNDYLLYPNKETNYTYGVFLPLASNNTVIIGTNFNKNAFGNIYYNNNPYNDFVTIPQCTSNLDSFSANYTITISSVLWRIIIDGLKVDDFDYFDNNNLSKILLFNNTSQTLLTPKQTWLSNSVDIKQQINPTNITFDWTVNKQYSNLVNYGIDGINYFNSTANNSKNSLLEDVGVFDVESSIDFGPNDPSSNEVIKKCLTRINTTTRWSPTNVGWNPITHKHAYAVRINTNNNIPNNSAMVWLFDYDTAKTVEG